VTSPIATTRRLTWLGHATVLLETHGVRLLTDPVLGSRVAHLRRHQPAPPYPRRIDGVLVSHVHHDHLDRPSLRRLANPATTALIPVGAARWLPADAFGEVLELRPGEQALVGGLPVAAVPAWHPARRFPGSPVLESLGFVVDRIWFAGDTGVDAAMESLRGEVDVALVPIWGWGTGLGPGHMDPEEAAQAVALVRPRIAVPIHWGTFLPIGMGRRHRQLLHDPPVAFARHVGRLAPATRVVTLRPGASHTL
jgi:L-ascorbate metabolism protein UlaG (beta-lactamase superfamily)